MRVNRLLLILLILSACSNGSRPDAGNITGSPEIRTATPTHLPLIHAIVTIPPALANSTIVTQETRMLTPAGPSAPSRQVILEAVGDIMLARTVGDLAKSQGPGIIFAGVNSVLKSADVLVGNLECALTTGGEPQLKNYTFAAPPETAQALAQAGFDLLSLANNHAMDYGIQGLTDTRSKLEEVGISSVGAGVNITAAHTPVILERNGLRLAFLAYVNVPVENNGFDTRSWIATDTQPGVAWADPDRITTDVIAAREQADVVIVQLHAGYEIGAYIPSVSSDQQAAARAAIDAGAVLVIGSHSHVLQAIEQYHGGLIAYSLGNFVFNEYEGIANASIILRVVLTPTGIQSYDWVPVLIENGLPRLTTDLEVPAIGTMVAP